MKSTDMVVLLLGGVALYALFARDSKPKEPKSGDPNGDLATKVSPGTPAGDSTSDVIAATGRAASSFIDALDNLFN